ncbi:MAG: Zn-dependent hydrolase, partial [Bacteroidota bacterium]
GLGSDEERMYALINYGPWDRLDGDAPFVAGVGDKPLGANFYPADMTKEEFTNSDIENGTSLYTFIRRNENGELESVPYSRMFPEQMDEAASLLTAAAEYAEDEDFKNYLLLRAEALVSDEYFESDMAWMSTKDNMVDLVIGPIETYEDQLFGYKAAHEGYVLIKDMEWSQRLARYADFLPSLQENLPVEPAYKTETPGRDADLNAYDVVYYAGDCNAGSKTIAINLPNDEQVQLEKGSRRLQLKNAMRAKYDKILIPISEVLIDESQRQHITFDAFFSNTMFHEVAHGLGIKNTINERGTVKDAIKEHYSALEEGKADILGLYMIQQLHAQGELEADLHDYYVTFMTGIFRSVRFGASSAHGKANMIRFNFFQERGAFTRNEETGTYKVNFDAFERAVEELSQIILTLQGDGNYEGVADLVAQQGVIRDELQGDLNRLEEAGIPVDIIF